MRLFLILIFFAMVGVFSLVVPLAWATPVSGSDSPCMALEVRARAVAVDKWQGLAETTRPPLPAFCASVLEQRVKATTPTPPPAKKSPPLMRQDP